MDFSFGTVANGPPELLLPSTVQKTYAEELSNWAQECRKRVLAVEAEEPKARQYEGYFSDFMYRQQQLQQQTTTAQNEEFRRYLSEYQACWSSNLALDPRTLLTMFREMECSLMQARDELSSQLTQWKNDQALAQIGRPSNGHELQPIAMRFFKLDNLICDAIGLVSRFKRFVSERYEQSNVTEMGPFWQGAMHECVQLVSRMGDFRRELQRETFIPFEQPPYIVRRFAGKTKATGESGVSGSGGSGATGGGGDDAGSGPGSGDEDSGDYFDDGQSEAKFPKHVSRPRGGPSKDTNNNGDASRKGSGSKDSKKEHKVVFDLRVRLMVGDKGHIGENTKVHAILLTDQQCRELVNRHLTAYDDPLTVLSEIGPPLTAAAMAGKAQTKRKVPAARRRTPNLPGTPPFAAGQLTPHDACLTYDSSLEHFEAFFQNMKVNEKDRNPEADAQARFYRILFVTKLKDTNSKDFYIWCLSVPFPIVVNATRQEKSTSAKIFCHLALTATTDPIDRPLQSIRMHSPNLQHHQQQQQQVFPQCPSVGSGMSEHRYIPWSECFDRLNWWWLKHTGAKTGLLAHEVYLAMKLGVQLGNPDACIAMDQLTKKCEPFDFSFWDWLFMIADYVKRNIHYWDSGFLLGFASKEQINAYLAHAKGPVMFIRFSDSTPGSLVIGYGMTGREPQHIILQQKTELKQHKLTFFIQQSKQLTNVHHIATSLNPEAPLRSKSEFLKLEEVKPASANDEHEAMTKRGYTTPKLTFDWGEPPPNLHFGEHDDESTCTSINFQEFMQDELFDNQNPSPYGFDDLTAAALDPNGFSTALGPNMAMSPPQPQAPGAWNGGYPNSSMGSPAGAGGALSNTPFANL